jgi:hypothetical protein
MANKNARTSRLPLSCAPLALAAFLLSRAAGAQVAEEIVVLNDGSTYQGKLVEKVPGDHVTIKLATGEVKRFDWSAIASTRDEQPLLPPPPPLPASSAGGQAGAAKGEDLTALGPGLAGSLVDWQEPDRTPPSSMASRLSVGVLAGYQHALGVASLEAEYYPWNAGPFDVGFHAAYGPWGALGPTFSGMLALDFTLVDWLRYGFGAGVTESLRSGPTAVTSPGTPDSWTFLEVDLSHVDVFVARVLTIHLRLARSYPIPGCDPCGRLDVGPQGFGVLGGVLWNFDISPGDH